MTTKYQRELAEYCQWDPADASMEPEAKINKTKINHLTKRYLAEHHESPTDLEKQVGANLYDIAKKHPTGNNVLLIMGKCTMEDYVKKSIEHKGDKFVFHVIDDTETYLNTLREAQSELTEILKQPNEISVGGLGKLTLPTDGALTAINTLLQDNKLPSLEDVFHELSNIEDTINDAMAEKDTWKTAHAASVDEVNRLKTEVTNLMTRVSASTSAEYSNERGEIPDGKVVMKKASEVFPGIKLERDFEIPTWEWDGDHPDVPVVDENYIFRPQHLQRALYAIITNQREYIQGHTGSGKTTLIEQIAARMNYPFFRVNFDSEITRMDLIGRDTLVSDEDGKITSQFIDGMLPTAMSGPYICCFDEIDFVRPDVGYVMQAALEGNGLRITEDGDRLVEPHPMFRMFGTGNTVGQGDEHGMYQGARPQSMAFLDRFTIWDKIDYLTEKEREDLVDRKYPALTNDDKKVILQYTTEHLEAFTQGKVIQPISPRGMLAICQATILLGSVKEALGMTVIDRCNIEDRVTLKGLVDRVTK